MRRPTAPVGPGKARSVVAPIATSLVRKMLIRIAARAAWGPISHNFGAPIDAIWSSSAFTCLSRDISFSAFCESTLERPRRACDRLAGLRQDCLQVDEAVHHVAIVSYRDRHAGHPQFLRIALAL